MPFEIIILFQTRIEIIQLVSPEFLAINGLINLIKDNYANGCRPYTTQWPRRHAFQRLHERVGPIRTTLTGKLPVALPQC